MDTTLVETARSVVDNVYIIVSTVIAIAGTITTFLSRRQINKQKNTIKNIGQRLGDKL